ncbi:hypothetical protein Tco_0907439 [Tanacetum coccineum]|uniref:Uncharacterized protein n=1 Tax=Tanacetum coccineum TaxID=301880 RepID=A0ABQ5CQM2_9ASTR
MLKKFDRDDLIKLWDLVKERFNITELTDDKEKELWVELKRFFEQDSDDTLLKLQRYMHDPLVWRLYDTCVVHHVSSLRGHDIFMLWQSRFLRYIDTRPNGDALRKCILQGPYTPTTVIIPAVPATDNAPAVPERTTVETILNMSPKNKAHYESEKEAIHLLMTRIGDEIYSTVDACKAAHEMWIAIERLQQGESLNIQDVNTNLFWEFGKFTSQDGESMESNYSRFYKLMNEMIRNNLTVATMQVNV